MRLPLLDLGEEEADRVGALLADRLVDRRQGRVDVGGEVDVVEADDAEVAGMRRPSSRAALIAPIAIASLIARTAVGRRPAAQARWKADGAALDRGAAGHDAIGRAARRRRRRSAAR